MKFVLSTTLALALLASAPALAQNRIDVMTQNQYLGADLTPIIAAISTGDPVAINEAILAALQEIIANDYVARSKQLAELIADRLPELVGLQEMFKFDCIPLAPPGQDGKTACDDPSIQGAFNDHLDATLTELAELGEMYADRAIVENLNTQLPVDIDSNGELDIVVTVLDRDVILARGDIAASVTPLDQVLDLAALCPPRDPAQPEDPDRTSVNGCNYRTVASAGPITIERGWVGVDVTIGNKDYRFVDTHLEVQNPDPTNPLSPAVQAAQAQELIAVLGANTPSTRSLIVVGDINSSSQDPIINDSFLIVPPYKQFVDPAFGGDYTDAWDFVKPADEPGFSCCQDADLRNPQSILDERIDVIFSIEVPKNVKKARVLGAEIQDKTLPGPRLWPSDHGSVAAELQFK